MLFSGRFLLSGNWGMRKIHKITLDFEENFGKNVALLQGVTDMDTDVTRFLHVFGIRDHSIGIWNPGNLVLKPFLFFYLKYWQYFGYMKTTSQNRSDVNRKTPNILVD